MSLVGGLIGILVALIVGVAVVIPIVRDQVNPEVFSNITNTTSRELAFTGATGSVLVIAPIILAVVLIVAVMGLIR
jgi:hypothetical protein